MTLMYSTHEVVSSYRKRGAIWKWVAVEDMFNRTFGLKWVTAREIEDPDARAFALNALADSVPVYTYKVDFNLTVTTT